MNLEDIKRKSYGDTPGTYLNARDNFLTANFHAIVDIFETEMKIRGEIHKERADKFSFLGDVPRAVNFIIC